MVEPLLTPIGEAEADKKCENPLCGRMFRMTMETEWLEVSIFARDRAIAGRRYFCCVQCFEQWMIYR